MSDIDQLVETFRDELDQMTDEYITEPTWADDLAHTDNASPRGSDTEEN